MLLKPKIDIQLHVTTLFIFWESEILTFQVIVWYQQYYKLNFKNYEVNHLEEWAYKCYNKFKVISETYAIKIYACLGERRSLRDCVYTPMGANNCNYRIPIWKSYT